MHALTKLTGPGAATLLFAVFAIMRTCLACQYNIAGIPADFVMPGIVVAFGSNQAACMRTERSNFSVFHPDPVDQLHSAHMINSGIKSHFT